MKESKTSDTCRTEETEALKLFQLEIETGSIKEKDVSEKVVKSNMLKQRSTKAVVLKLRRLREDHSKHLEPPSEQLTSSKKVIRYQKEAEFQKEPSVSSAMSISANLRDFGESSLTNRQDT